MIRLIGSAKSYPWGSASVLHEYLGWPTDGEPLAELWFGDHPAGPSAVVGGSAPDLRAHIAADPVGALGGRPGERRSLPFLLKLLAPGEPVSLQVHPSSAAARAGFDDEQRRGVDLAAPDRIFTDDSTKPELVLAVTTFEGLAGFRSVDAIRATLALLPDVGGLRAALDAGPGRVGRAALLQAALLATPDDLDALVAAARSRTADSAIATLLELADRHPGDVGAVAGLILERHVLQPGDALHVPAGTPHCYLSGLAVEVMANSDTVLRGGLSSKHVDVRRFLQCIDVIGGPIAPFRVANPAPPVRLLSPAGAPFTLAVVAPGGGEVAIPGWGPRIALTIDDRVQLRSASGAERSVARGEAFFIEAADGVLTASGSGTLVVAGAAGASRHEKEAA